MDNKQKGLQPKKTREKWVKNFGNLFKFSVCPILAIEVSFKKKWESFNVI